MTPCRYCNATEYHWFTPQGATALGAVLLCASCQRLNVHIPRRTPRATTTARISDISRPHGRAA